MYAIEDYLLLREIGTSQEDGKIVERYKSPPKKDIVKYRSKRKISHSGKPVTLVFAVKKKEGKRGGKTTLIKKIKPKE